MINIYVKNIGKYAINFISRIRKALCGELFLLISSLLASTKSKSAAAIVAKHSPNVVCIPGIAYKMVSCEN